MVRINDIWFYFLDEKDIPYSYLDEYSGSVYEENDNDFIVDSYESTLFSDLHPINFNQKRLLLPQPKMHRNRQPDQRAKK